LSRAPRLLSSFKASPSEVHASITAAAVPNGIVRARVLGMAREQKIHKQNGALPRVDPVVEQVIGLG